MKWLSKKKGNDAVSYWQTIVDILSALFLVILLISLLLILYILRYPEETEPDPDPGDYRYETDSVPGNDWHPDVETHSGDGDGYRYEYRPVTSGGGGGGGGGSGFTGDTDHEFTETGWSEEEGRDKAAVYTRLLDAETGKIIREKDVLFSLSDPAGKQELLAVYYPEKVTFREFATTGQGTFYLPEKIRLGTHRLKELTEPYGYDASDDIEFTVEESHEWEEPYILDVPLYPSRNVIRILQTDAADGKPLSGGLYRITAAGDIITADGTLRYHAGDELGEITCDENGVGVSQELYLGEYRITQLRPPETYVLIREPLPAATEKKKDGVPPEAYCFACTQTAFSLVLTDELRPEDRLRDVAFSFRRDGDPQPQTLLTDGSGSLRLTGLAPDASYTLRQESAATFYTDPDVEITFTVDSQGLIDGQPEKAVQVTNRMLRTTVLIRDRILRNPISDRSVSLFGADGNCIAQWTSSGNPHELNGLAAGTYRLVMAGTAEEMSVTVTDRAEIQACEFSVMTRESLIGLGAGGLVLLGGGLFILIRGIKKRRNKRS